MTKRQFLPKFAAMTGVTFAVALLVLHIIAWFFAAPDQGSHVQDDFVQAGFSFTLAQQAAGALLEGLPKAAYALALFTLFPLLWSSDAGIGPVKRRLSRASALLLAGAGLLLVYPSLTSIAFSLLEPGDVSVVLLSLPPTVIVTVIGSLVFAATASRLRGYLLERQS